MLGLLLLVLSAEPGGHVPRHRDALPVLGDERVSPALRRHAKRFLRCAERLPPGAHGRVVIRFAVDREGHAHGFSESQDTLRQPGAVHCLEQALAAIAFGPASAETARVDVPFEFRATE